jgi:hypothetical protein
MSTMKAATNYPKETGTQWPASMSSRRPAEDILAYLRDFAREKPDVAALWCFGIGFVLGWKLKPW